MTTDEPREGGVTLRQYAAVLAGVAEGFALADVLANEGVDPRRWAAAEDAWSDRIGEESDEEEALDAMFDERLAEARARYGRRVRPLDESLRAWLDFTRRWSAAEDPVKLLGELGLRSTDMLRLHRLWSERLAADPGLQRQAKAILESDPQEIGPLEVEPSRLVPPPHPEPVVVGEAGDALEDDDDDDDDDLEDVDFDALADDAELPPIFAPLPGKEGEGPVAEPSTLPAMLSPLRHLRATPQAAAAAASAAGAAAASAAGTAPAPAVAGVHAPAAAAAPAPAAAAAPSAGQTAPPPPLPEGEPSTLPATLSPLRNLPALPFKSVPAGAAPPAIAVAGPPVKQMPKEMGRTMVGATSPFADALPFAKQGAPATTGAPAATGTPPAATGTPPTSASPQAPQAKPAVMPAPKSLVATTMDIGEPLRAALPFAAARLTKPEAAVIGVKTGAAPEVPAPVVPAADTAAGPAKPPMKPLSKEMLTTMVGATSPLAQALPFTPAKPAAPSQAGPPQAAPQPAASPAAAPQAAPIAPSIPAAHAAPAAPAMGASPAAPGAADVPGPFGITLAQYASLCAELAAYPAGTERTFARYGLTTAEARAAVDTAYKQRLAADAAQKAMWSQLYRRYFVYWSDQVARGVER